MFDVRHSVVIRRLSSSTGVRDCGRTVWEFLGLSREDVAGRTELWPKCPLIGDFGFDVWILETRGKRFVGKTIVDVLEAAGIS